MVISTVPSQEAIERLRGALHGRLVTPDDPEYDDLRAVMAGWIDRRPALIVRVADAADVATSLAFAREQDLEVAVRSGGHSGAGHGATDGGLVIDVRDLRELEIDPATRTAWAGAGLTAGEYTVAAEEHGLATGFGDTGSVGISGLTLGGGIGYLVRKHGLTIDSLLEAEIVTADGEVRRVDASTEPDLFWAIRGGGGNFGVVTRLRYALHPISGFAGGLLVLPATADTVAGFLAAAEAAPEELSTIANVMNCPPMPFVAEAWHGRIVILAMLAWAGEPDAADAAFAPFRALAEPLADQLAPMAYAGMYPPEEGGEGEAPLAVARSLFLDHVDRDLAGQIVDRLETSDASLRAVQLRVLGGAMARVPGDATAFAHRSSRIMAAVAAFYEGDDRPVRQAWVDELAALLRQSDDGVYVNFLEDEGPERVRAAYPGATWDRLVALKARYDPANVFRLNQNVPPR